MYNNVNLFPNCEFILLKPPQTQADQRSREFGIEFEDFKNNVNEIIDKFDIALVSCGGYANPICSHINVGTGHDVTISELANTMARVVGFEGDIEFDTSKPDGTPRKLLDVSRLSSLDWHYSVELEHGLEMTYQWFLDNLDELRS